MTYPVLYNLMCSVSVYQLVSGLRDLSNNDHKQTSDYVTPTLRAAPAAPPLFPSSSPPNLSAGGSASRSAGAGAFDLFQPFSTRTVTRPSVCTDPLQSFSVGHRFTPRVTESLIAPGGGLHLGTAAASPRVPTADRIGQPPPPPLSLQHPYLGACGQIPAAAAAAAAAAAIWTKHWQKTCGATTIVHPFAAAAAAARLW